MRMRFPRVLAALSALLLAGAAFADGRPFTADVQRGKLTPAPWPNLVIDGKVRALAPGARIWNTDNLIVQPASLRGEDIVVNYVLTEDGQLDRVWILTREEAAESVKAQRERAQKQ